jgi:hypothetical protein
MHLSAVWHADMDGDIAGALDAAAVKAAAYRRSPSPII